MRWLKEFLYIPQYEYVSINQHGRRYKQSGTKKVHVAVMSTPCDNIDDMKTLILLSACLDVPVHYDFDTNPQKAFIKVVGQRHFKQF